MADREKNRLWRLANPAKAKASIQRRRSRLSNTINHHTAEDIKRIYKMQKGKCAYCRRKLNDEYEVDHIVPLSKGGSNEARNIQLLCHKKYNACNRRKHAKDPIDYARSLGRLI